MPSDSLETDSPFLVKPETPEYEALSFLTRNREQRFTLDAIVAQTSLDSHTATPVLEHLVDTGLLTRIENTVFLPAKRAKDVQRRLESIDAAERLFLAAPEGDAYTEQGWEADVPNLDPER